MHSASTNTLQYAIIIVAIYVSWRHAICNVLMPVKSSTVARHGRFPQQPSPLFTVTSTANSITSTIHCGAG
ncbi:uncharacterized protein B0J16DRAFT_369911 [Fusarium flagelliforme]|uniref:uncharacterized protein n=1 Tax=Fusarium flagelliforme TaxID=2675880 RepID=UPI001E8D3945|nr:uncharacterized protein B0J16DRAFT_369911 [Fusarium flagelliforme]KAH7193843.1 hypothetical protein B0J16DRAFT_369911 [Fusarium flagelliforme]